MAEHHNGNSFEMGRLWGQLQGHMHHHGEALERQNEILLDIKDTLTDLPYQIASRIGTQGSVIPSRPDQAEGILKAIPPILATAAALLTVIGLMTERVAWSDIPQIAGLGEYVSSK